ncbi:MAG: hypothetical protein GWO11_09230 [Desulfuromonadales bacterium]|nr:hypothetical protein [Desulfuromonadales bacterium]NIR34464.1 hypothetical protein [Desulfuromonadales bacterium]NIS43001.1 hypothetical protein [Desulfuromonadales bacterium]
MSNEDTLVHECQMEIAGSRYEIHVFLQADGRHVAKTVLASDDVLINDGPSLEEVLAKHRNLLPLAIDSRAMLQSYLSSRRQ